MRQILHALVGGLLIGSCFSDANAQSGPGWWPFGRSDAEESQPPGVDPTSGMPTSGHPEQNGSTPQAPTDEKADQRWMIDSPLAKVSWPRLHMPEVPKPQMPRLPFWPNESEVDAPRNAWAEDPNAMQPSPLQAVTDGARRVGDKTRAAWDKTVDALTPGDDSNNGSSRIARRDTGPPWWKRMFVVEEGEPQGPQTVTEWMAQERLDP